MKHFYIICIEKLFIFFKASTKKPNKYSHLKFRSKTNLSAILLFQCLTVNAATYEGAVDATNNFAAPVDCGLSDGTEESTELRLSFNRTELDADNRIELPIRFNLVPGDIVENREVCIYDAIASTITPDVGVEVELDGNITNENEIAGTLSLGVNELFWNNVPYGESKLVRFSLTLIASPLTTD